MNVDAEKRSHISKYREGVSKKDENEFFHLRLFLYEKKYIFYPL